MKFHKNGIGMRLLMEFHVVELDFINGTPKMELERD
jgi:hypothetical protein